MIFAISVELQWLMSFLVRRSGEDNRGRMILVDRLECVVVARGKPTRQRQQRRKRKWAWRAPRHSSAGASYRSSASASPCSATAASIPSPIPSTSDRFFIFLLFKSLLSPDRRILVHAPTSFVLRKKSLLKFSSQSCEYNDWEVYHRVHTNHVSDVKMLN